MDLEQVNKTIKMLINNIDFYNMIIEEERFLNLYGTHSPRLA